MEAINKVFPRLICHLWSVTPFSGCNDVIPVLQPHVHQRSYWDGLALNFLLKRHLSKVEEKCVQYNQRWAVELSGSVGWQKLHLKAFGTKNLDPPNPQPVRSLLQPITLLLVGLADLASAVCPSCPSIHTSIHSSLHFISSIHPSIHPSTHSTDPSKRFIQPYSAGVWPKDDSVSGRNRPDRTRCFLRVPLASKHLPHSQYTLKKYGFLCFGGKLYKTLQLVNFKVSKP